MDKAPPGRPRLYGSTSEKVEAFRKRQESAGYLRKEILVPKETWDQVNALAKRYSVSTADAAAGLLEHGLKRFIQEHAASVPEVSEAALRTAYSAFQGAIGAAPVALSQGFVPLSTADFEKVMNKTFGQAQAASALRGVLAAPETATNAVTPPKAETVNPITQFFQKRKNLSND